MAGMVSFVAIILLPLTLWNADSSAQGRRSKFSIELSTLNSVNLETGKLDAQAQRCGLAVSDLQTPARAVLSTSRLSERQSAPDSLFINASVVAIDEMCVAAIDVELFRWSTEFRTSVSVWAHKAVLAGGKDGFNSQVRERIEAMTKEFLGDWLKARQ